MSTRGSRAGFTLVELLIAVTLTALMIAFLAQAINGALTTWQNTENRTDTIREARAALDIISRDLRHLVQVPSAPALVMDFHKDTKPEDKVNQEIYMLTAVPNSGRSDVCTVGYYCQWDPDLKAFRLMRHFKNSDDTTKSIRDLFAGGSLTFEKLYRVGGNDEQLAAFIWDLKFDTPSSPPSAPYPQGSFSEKFPASVEIRMKAISSRQGRLLKDLPITRDTWMNGTSGAQADLYRSVILPYQQQLVTRVRL